MIVRWWMRRSTPSLRRRPGVWRQPRLALASQSSHEVSTGQRAWALPLAPAVQFPRCTSVTVHCSGGAALGEAGLTGNGPRQVAARMSPDDRAVLSRCAGGPSRWRLPFDSIRSCAAEPEGPAAARPRSGLLPRFTVASAPTKEPGHRIDSLRPPCT